MLKCYKESKENVEDLKGMLHQVRLCIRVKDIPTLVPLFGRVPIQTPNFLRAGQVISCRAMCGDARAHMGMPKMLSHDRPCAFFGRVVHPWKPQISFG